MSARIAARLAVRPGSQLIEPVEQFAERVPGDHGLPVWFGEAGLHGAESAVADDHLRVRGPVPCQAQQLIRLAEGAWQPVPDQPDAEAAHLRPRVVIPEPHGRLHRLLLSPAVRSMEGASSPSRVNVVTGSVPRGELAGKGS